LEKEAYNSLHSKLYESFLRTFLEERISYYVVDENNLRKIENVYEWDSLHLVKNRFNIEDVIHIFKNEFEAEDFRTIQFCQLGQRLEVNDWIFVETKFNLDNAISKIENRTWK